MKGDVFMNEKFYVYLLLHVYGVGAKTILKWWTSPKRTYDFNHLRSFIAPQFQCRAEESYHAVLSQQENWYQLYKKEQFITIKDDVYPKWLKEIYNPPPFLFYRGDIHLMSQPCLAIIGSRQPIDYSYYALEMLLPKLASKYVIVSGMARGIDTLSHQRTIFYHGRTIGVLGNSLDYVYPKENKQLQERMGNEQLLISEYPLHTPPLASQFPQRNRIISGLSQGTVVIQAAQKSGTMITANQALEEGREVFAVPGCINHPAFLGCHHLIQNGAKLVTNADDIIEELKFW